MVSVEVDEYEPSEEVVRYLAFLHDFIGMAHERLSQVLSPQAANTLLSGISERALEHFEISQDPKKAESDVKLILTRLGMKINKVKVGNNMVTRLECPFASTMHEKMQKAVVPICPIGVLILAAERRSNKGVRLKKMILDEKGAQLVTGT